MNYLSVCSGIEAATVAWHPLGWTPVGFGEIERFPCQVLAHHYPTVPNFGDMTKFKEWQIESDVNVLVGGTPCQSFSVAGLRKGLDDPRGNLMLTYLAIAAKHRPKWLVWENVPGVLSSNGGLDFASLLRGMGELGYGFAYRVLDAQYFGVAQRRRRVFVVGYLGNWQRAAAVLFERHSLCGYPAPSREARKVTPIISSSGTGVSRVGFNCEDEWFIETPVAARMVAFGEYSVDGTASAMKARDWKDATDLVAQPIPLNTMNLLGREVDDGRRGFGIGEAGDPCPTLTKAHSHAVAQPIPLDMMNIRGRPSDDGRANRIGRGYGEVGDPMFTITKANHHAVAQPIAFSGQMSNPQTDVDMTQTLQAKNPMAVMQPSMAVRRLSPKECERLQGFPDNYTDIKLKGKPTPDGPRYKALGNSMAVPVMAWIGQRIQQVENIK